MSYYQSTAPPKLWSQMSRKKKAKYMDVLKQLYGGKDATEAASQRNTNPDRKTGTSEALYVVKEK
jgi:hypothetical protein